MNADSRALGICYLIHGGAVLLASLGTTALLSLRLAGVASGIQWTVLTTCLSVGMLLSGVAFAAGMSLLRHGARAGCLLQVAALVSLFTFPMGTALACATVWLLYRGSGSVHATHVASAADTFR